MIKIVIAVGTNYGSTATTTTTTSSSSSAVAAAIWRLPKNNSKAGSSGTDLEQALVEEANRLSYNTRSFNNTFDHCGYTEDGVY